MFTKIRNFLNQAFDNSRKVNNEPLNKMSLIVIIIVDIFILVNVFTGLDDISRLYLSPTEIYPCYSEWSSYQKDTTSDKDFQLIRKAIPPNDFQFDFQARYKQVELGHLGKVSEVCLKYASLKDNLNNPENQQIITNINRKQGEISSLEQANRTIRNQYDSTLLEKIAGQSPDNSINQVGAEKAKQELDKNTQRIATLKQEISVLKQEVIKKSNSVDLLALIKDQRQFNTVQSSYQSASFWYPTIQFLFQSIFLAPLIIIALFVHRQSQRRGYGLVALISWHLLVIFLIPLLLKVLEFLQAGVIFRFLVDIFAKIFGGLLFLVNYLYIFLVPVFGWVLIKLFQKVVFNRKHQAAKRVEKSQCINCGKKIKSFHAHCSHCGYYQYVECHHCHELTYKKLPYCYHCGTEQNVNEEVGSS